MKKFYNFTWQGLKDDHRTYLWDNNSMSRLIIIRGDSGSGKSTIAKRLQYELGYGTMLIPQDVVRREIIRTKDIPKNPSIQLIKDITMYGHNIGYDVIIEGILVRKRYGKMLHELAKLFNETHAYYFDISLDETLRRHKTKANSHEFGETQMRKWYIEKDTLNLADEKIFTDTKSEDEVFQIILKDLQ